MYKKINFCAAPKAVTMCLVSVILAQTTLKPMIFSPFENVQHIIICSGECSIQVRQSPDIFTRVKATGQGAGSLKVHQEGNVLNLKNKSDKTDFFIELGNNFIPKMDINTGNGKIEIKTSVNDLNIASGNLELYAQDLKGDISFSCGKGSFTLVHKIFIPVSYQINAGNAHITALLSSDYTNVYKDIKGGLVSIEESFLPVVISKSDFNLSGNIGFGKIFIRKLD